MGEPGGQGADPVLSGSSTGEGGGEGVDPCSKYRRASLVSSQTRAGQEGRGTDALRQGEQSLGQPWSECWPEGPLGWVGGGALPLLLGAPEAVTETSRKSLFVAFPAQTKSIRSGNMRTADLWISSKPSKLKFGLGPVWRCWPQLQGPAGEETRSTNASKGWVPLRPGFQKVAQPARSPRELRTARLFQGFRFAWAPPSPLDSYRHVASQALEMGKLKPGPLCLVRQPLPQRPALAAPAGMWVTVEPGGID